MPGRARASNFAPSRISYRSRPMKYELPAVDDTPIWDIWLSHYKLPALTAALKIGLIEALAQAPYTADQLCEQLGFERPNAQVILQMLVVMGLLDYQQEQYHLTEVSRLYLVKDSPFYWGGVLDVVCEDNRQHLALIEKLGGSAAALDDPFEPPAESWEKGQVELEQARRIARFMHSHSCPAAAGMAKNSLFGEVKRLLDVGGGSGCFSIALAQSHAVMHCTIMDLPTMCEIATDYIAEGSVSDRVDAVAVDMFREEWPAGYDAMLFSNVFHDWNMETNADLAASAFSALPSGGRIFLHEMLLDDSGVGPETANAFSVLMLVGTKGRQFVYAELAELLEHAGFTDIAVQPTYGYYSLVSGRKI